MKFYKAGRKIVVPETELVVGEELIPNTGDAAFEKHVHVIKHTDFSSAAELLNSLRNPCSMRTGLGVKQGTDSPISLEV